MSAEQSPSSPSPAGEAKPEPAPASSTDAVTWDSTIKNYFLPVDVECMVQKGGFDLSKKEDVKEHADDIYLKTKNKLMPKQMPPWTQKNPDPAHPLWTDKMCEDFKAWMDADFP